MPGGRDLVGVEIFVAAETPAAYPRNDHGSIVGSVYIRQDIAVSRFAQHDSVIRRATPRPLGMSVGIKPLKHNVVVTGPAHHDTAVTGGCDFRICVEAR